MIWDGRNTTLSLQILPGREDPVREPELVIERVLEPIDFIILLCLLVRVGKYLTHHLGTWL